MSLYRTAFALTAIFVTAAARGGDLSPSQRKEFDRAAKVIKSSFPIRSAVAPGYSCELSVDESCDISDMPADQSTIVSPGGMTRCIYSTSTPYSFQVVPGNTEKLLVYFQGGGACWDKISTVTGMCTTDCVPAQLNGVFDRTNSLNEYKDYTIVHAMYCSGDVWLGNVTRPYDDPNGELVVQSGYYNAKATLDWIVSQQANGNIASTLTNLVVMGCSAGSIGAQLWGNNILKELKWKTAAVVPDSYAGVFPDGTQGPLIYDYGACTVMNNFVTPESGLVEMCNNEALTLQDIMKYNFETKPNIPYGYLQSKVDDVQISFYIAIGLTSGVNAEITPEEFYEKVNVIFGAYNKEKNFLTYLVDGPKHCFTPYDVYFSTDAKGSEDGGQTNEQQMMYPWVGSYPLYDGTLLSTVCEGDLLLQSQSGSRFRNLHSANGVSSGNYTYCDTNVYPKQFIQQY